MSKSKQKMSNSENLKSYVYKLSKIFNNQRLNLHPRDLQKTVACLEDYQEVQVGHLTRVFSTSGTLLWLAFGSS